MIATATKTDREKKIEGRAKLIRERIGYQIINSDIVFSSIEYGDGVLSAEDHEKNANACRMVDYLNVKIAKLTVELGFV